MLSPENQSFIADCRLKATAGTISLDDMKKCIIILRSSRKSAVEASASGRASKAAKAPPTDKKVEDMLSELEGL